MEELERIYATAHARYRLYMRRLRPDLSGDGRGKEIAIAITAQWKKLRCRLEELMEA